MNIDQMAAASNKLRIIPKILVLSSALYFGWYSWEVTTWYMELAVRTAEESAFAASVITLLGGVIKFIIDKFMDTDSTHDVK